MSRRFEPPGSKTTSDREGQGHLWARRSFLTRLGWLGVLGTLGASMVAFVRLLFPRAPIEAPTHFSVGKPSEFPPGTVTGRLPPDGRGRTVWMVRTDAGLYGLYGRCTHLGCTPHWQTARSYFKCPCHGSVFTKEGENVSGPAPRPLERVAIRLDDRGRIEVDPERRFRQERGEWDEEDAFLPWKPEGPSSAGGSDGAA